MVWHLLTTQPQREGVVFGHLIGRGIPAYMPSVPVTRNRGVRKIKTTLWVPMFRSYVFVAPECGRHYQLATGSPCAHRFLSFDESHISVVPEEEVARVRQTEEKLRLDAKKPIAERLYKPGDVIRIVEDLWEGIMARVRGVDSRGRVTLQGPMGRIVVQAHQIEPA